MKIASMTNVKLHSVYGFVFMGEIIRINSWWVQREIVCLDCVCVSFTVNVLFQKE